MKKSVSTAKEPVSKTGPVKTTGKVNYLLIGLGFVLLALVCIAYWNHFNNPFQYDDGFAIFNNYYIRSLHNIPLFFTDVKTSCTYTPNQVYRPLYTTLNAIDCWLGGKGEPVPFYYHRTIFICFLALGVFIYLLAIKTYNTAYRHVLNPYIALLTTAVFMLHTANAETINYIYERSDSFSTLMVLVSLCTFIYLKTWRKYLIYLVPMLIGLLVKEPAALVAPLIFLYMFFFEEELGLNKIFSFAADWRVLRVTLPAFILGAVLFIYTQKMTQWWSAEGYLHQHFSFVDDVLPYLYTQAFVIVHYFNNFIFPVNLSADSDWTLITNPLDDRVVIGAAFILFTFYLAYKASLQAKSRPIAYGILWFYLALAPTSSIFPQPEVLIDHREFFAFIGLSMAVVWAFFLLYVKYETTISGTLRTAIVLLISIFLLAHVYGVRQRTKVWSSDESLWHDSVNKNPRNGRGLMYYGKILMGKGDYNGALYYFTSAKEAWPNYQYTHINLGVLYNAMGRYAEAEQSFKYALQLDPRNADCYYYYARALKDDGRAGEAAAIVRKGLEYNPARTDLLDLNSQLATTPTTTADASAKLNMLEASVKQKPTAESWLDLSGQYYNATRYQDCMNAAEESLKLKPGYDLAYNNICAANNALHQWDKAIAAGKKALALNPNSLLIKNNLQIAMDGKNTKK